MPVFLALLLAVSGPIACYGDNEDGAVKSLDIDADWRAAQASLKEAAAIPDTDDDGLAEAQQMAQIQAYNQEQSLTQKFANHDLGESAQPKVKQSLNIDALMGKMVMTDMFDEDELDKVKQALMAKQQHESDAKSQDLGESKGGRQHAVRAAQTLSVGLKQKMTELAITKKKLQKANKKVKAMASKVKSFQNEKSQETHMLGDCQNRMQHHEQALHAQYRKDLDSMGSRLQAASTQALLTKRALQMCEAKQQGAEGRAVARVARRTDRAVHRANMAMHKRRETRTMKKHLQVQVEKKLRQEFDAKLADKVGKLSHKKSSKLCAACSKLTLKEHKVLNVDCNACT